MLRAVCAAALLSALACTTPTEEPRPNVLWIVWDTVRADRLSLYGYAKPTTPFLERWAKHARVYDDCRANAGSTTPSHASMFTGLLPSEHGTYHTSRMLPDELDTVAELVQQAGYQTYLFAANPHISDKQNFHQGFDRHEHPWDERWREEAIRILRTKVPADDRSSDLPEKLAAGQLKPWNIKAAGELTERALLEWLAARDRGRPWFAFLNYMEAHIPYLPPRELRAKMMSSEQVQRSYEIDNRPVARWAFNFGLQDIPQEDLDVIAAVYDATLLELDGMLERLLGRLQSEGVLDNTVIIVTADHGEHLGEHHLLDHQYALYEPLLHVPLVVHYPQRFAAGRDASPVMLLDLFPTVLELTGVPTPAAASQAVSLLDARREGPRMAEYPAPFQPGLDTIRQLYPDWDPTPWMRRMRAFYRGEHKLICGTDGRHELYDVSADPGELRDLYASSPALGDDLLKELLAFSAGVHSAPPAQAAGELSEEERKRLEALGYVGGGGGTEHDLPEIAEVQGVCGFTR